MQFLCVSKPDQIPTDVNVLGIEIPGNRPDLIRLCDMGNIDPQHGGSAATGLCAAQDAVTKAGHIFWLFDRIPPNIAMVCTRIDLDAVAAMTVIAIASMGPPHIVKTDLLSAIGRADSFLAGAWPGSRPLPTPADPFLEHGTPEDIEQLSAANWLCGQAARGEISLEDAVQTIGEWLSGETVLLVPDEAYRHRIESLERARHLQDAGEFFRSATLSRAVPGEDDLRLNDRAYGGDVTAMNRLADLEVSSRLGGRVVYHDAIKHGPVSASLAYCLAPVSVVRISSPSRQMDGATKAVERYTIAAFDGGRFDFDRLVKELTEMEVAAAADAIRKDIAQVYRRRPEHVPDSAVTPVLTPLIPSLSWGGNVQTGRIVDSPQGQDSRLMPDQVLECLARCLTF